jgi:fluoride exporter
MSRPERDDRDGGDHLAELPGDRSRSLPTESDVDAAEDARNHPRRSPFPQATPARWPALRLDVIAAVFAGGCVGGWARYVATSGSAAPRGGFPWATFAVNVSGAFILALVIIAADVAPSRYLRPLLGTGFCGAFTTFSSVVVATDQLFAHHHPRTAVAYLTATVVAGLAASSFGLVIGRAIVVNRRRAHRDNPGRQERKPK